MSRKRKGISRVKAQAGFDEDERIMREMTPAGRVGARALLRERLEQPGISRLDEVVLSGYLAALDRIEAGDAPGVVADEMLGERHV